jgi:glucosamine--fructose-6-phosphate aminotransferase (isomerizing)
MIPPKIAFPAAVASQPDALRTSARVIDAALAEADLAPLRRGSVALLGIGASLYAAHSGAAQLRRQGLRAVAVPGTDLLDPAVDLADAYIAISASGRSVEPARAMEVRPAAATYGVAKTADAPLSQVVRTMIPTGSGSDSSPNTTSYLGSLLAIGMLADRVGRPSRTDWAALPDQVEAVLARSAETVAQAAALLSGRIAIDCVGSDVAFGTAGYASLLIREFARIHAQNWDTLNFLHGPMEPNDARSGVILFGAGREVKLAQDLAGFGIPAVLITSRQDVPHQPGLAIIELPNTAGLAEAILHAIPIQLLTSTLATLPECTFRYRQTDTKL